jgi:hypothetical protein
VADGVVEQVRDGPPEGPCIGPDDGVPVPLLVQRDPALLGEGAEPGQQRVDDVGDVDEGLGRGLLFVGAGQQEQVLDELAEAVALLEGTVEGADEPVIRRGDAGQFQFRPQDG